MGAKINVLGGLLGVLGGAALLAHVAMWVGYDLRANQNLGQSTTSPYWLLDRLAFVGAYALIGLAEAEAGLRLACSRTGRDGRRVALWRRVLGGLGGLVGLVPVAAGAFGAWVLLTRDPFAANEAGEEFGPPGVLGLFASAVLLGIALRRSGVLPTWSAVLLLAFGLLTIPLAMLLPEFAGKARWSLLEEGHFAPAGLAWVAIGLAAAWAGRRGSGAGTTGPAASA